MNTSFVANVFYKRSLLMGVSCLVLGSQISRFKLTFINGFAFTKFSKISLNAFFLLFIVIICYSLYYYYYYYYYYSFSGAAFHMSLVSSSK